MRIGLYCGSFAPVHNGHIGIVKQTLKEDIVDKIIIVPTKDYWNKTISIPFEKRVECLKLFEDETIIIDDDEKDCFTPNTYTLLENLKEKYPNDQLYLMIGADNLPLFKNWVNSEYLLKNYPFIIMNREGYDTKKELKKLNKKDYFLLNCDNFNVSSTYIRENIENYDKLKEMISFDVYQIIKNSIPSEV